MKLIIWILILAGGIVFGWYYFQSPEVKEALTSFFQIHNTGPTGLVREIYPTQIQLDENQTYSFDQTRTVEQKDKSKNLNTNIVNYQNDGFSPNSIKVRAGTKIQWRNNSKFGMQVMSDLHPDHTILPDLFSKQIIKTGGIFEYTFQKVGTWTYHNEANLKDEGVVVVVE